MEESGWISRSRCVTDERIVLIHTTERGDNLKPLTSKLPLMLEKELNDEGGRLTDLKNQLNELLSFISNKCKTKFNKITFQIVNKYGINKSVRMEICY